MEPGTRSGIVFTIIGIAVIVLAMNSLAAAQTPVGAISSPSASGYYVVHWPGEVSDIYFNEVLMGKTENHTLSVPIVPSTRKFTRYSVVTGNRTLFSDTLPAPPVPGEYTEVFPRWIQPGQSGQTVNATARTYVFFWPDDGVEVFVAGKPVGIVDKGFCRAGIPGRDIPGHPESPQQVVFRYPASGVERSYSIDILPEAGGLASYYLYWSLPFMYPPGPAREQFQANGSSPLWSDRFDASGLDISLSRSGTYGAIGTTDAGIAQLFSAQGNVLWAYQDPGKTLHVALDERGDLCAIGTRREGWTDEQSQGEIILAARNGTLLWSRPLDRGSWSIGIAPDGSLIYGITSAEISVFAQNGTKIAGIPISRTWAAPAPAGRGWIVTAPPDGIRYLAANGSQIWIYPINGWVSGLSLASDGGSGVARGGEHLYFFTRDSEVTWQKTLNSRITDAQVSGNGRYVAAGSQYRLYYFTDHGDLLWQKEHTGYVSGISASADGNLVAAVFEPRHIRIFDRTGNLTREIVLPDPPGAPVAGPIQAVLSQSGDYIAVYDGGRLYYFNTSGRVPITDDDEVRAAVISTTRQTSAPEKTPALTSPLTGGFILAPLAAAGVLAHDRKGRR